MPVTNFSPLLGLALPTTGDLSGTWGVTVNDSITSLLDSAISGTTSITVDADTNLTSTNGVADQSRQAVILWNPASGTTTRTITAPAKSKLYTVINASGGTQSIVFRATGQTGVTIVKGESALLAFNGTDFIKVSNTAGSGSFTNLTVSGTTTLSGLTASTALALDASKNVVSVTNTGTGNNVLSASPTFTGTLAAAAANFSGAVALGDAAADNITVNGTVTSNLIFTDNTYDIGASGATRPRNLFLAGNATVGGDIVLTGSLDLTNLEVTNIKAKDGTAGMQIADSTGVVSFTSNPVLTSGTALGVVLLNASKQMQAVAALTYDQGVFTNDGPTIVSNDVKATGAALTRLAGNSNTPGTTSFDLYQNATAGYVINRANSPLVFGVNDAEQMRLTSTGLGIGTSSPASKLGIVAAGDGTFNSQVVIAPISGSNPAKITFNPSVSSAIAGLSDGSLAFYGNGANTERMRLDSSGNLGLGVTPSAWGSAYRAIEVGGSGTSLFSGTGAVPQTYLTANAFFNGTNWIYKGTYPAIQYEQSGGQHKWNIAASGTAGNAISFTQAMTLDASGNLFVNGTTQIAGAKLNVRGTGSYIGVGGTVEMLFGDTGTSEGFIGSFTNHPFIFRTNNTERARITSDGNLVVGGTSPDGQFTIDNATTPYMSIRRAGSTVFLLGSANTLVSGGSTSDGALRTANALVFAAGGNTERARITSGGNFGIGTTSPNSRLDVDANTAANVTVLSLTNSANWGWGTFLDFRTPLTDGAAVGLAGRISSLFESSNNYALAFSTTASGTNAERARITSTGALLVGTTDGSQNGGNGNKLIAGGAVWVINAGSNDGFSYYNSSAAAYRFYVSANGTISATNTTISAISDQRLKENVQDLDVGLGAVMALKPRKFDWKEGSGKDIKGDRGFIAQEFEQVFPDLIDEWRDPAPEGEAPYKSVRQDLIPVLVKAIQEQQALINSLKARLDAANL